MKLLFLFLIPLASSLGQWTRTNWPEPNGPDYLYPTDTSLYALIDFDSKVYYSTNDGDTWTSIGPNVPFLWPKTAIRRGPYLLIGSSKGIFRTTNNGLLWTPSNNGLHDHPYQYPHADTATFALMATDSFLFAGTLHGIFRSSDNGVNWSKASFGLEYLDETTNALFSYGDTLFAGTYGGIYRSTNNGDSWSSVDSAPYAYDFATNGRAIFYRTQDFNKGIFRSTDHGLSWTQSDSGIWSHLVYGLVSYDTLLFAGTLNGGLFGSSNNGDLWNRINLGASVQSVSSLCKRNLTLFVGTNSGVWRGPANSLTSVTDIDVEAIPSSFHLKNPFPNPFNPVVSIMFDLSKVSFLTLKIYDALARELAILYSGTLGPGQYFFRWDASQMSSGVYVLRILGDGFSDTKKLIFAK